MMKALFAPALLGLFFSTLPIHGQDDYTLRFSEATGVVDQEGDIDIILDFADGALDVSGWQFGVCHDADMVEIDSIARGQALEDLNPDFDNTTIYDGEGWTVGVIISFLGLNVLAPSDDNVLHVATYDLLEEGDTEVEYCSNLGSPTTVDIIISDTDADPIDHGREVGPISIGTLPPFVMSVGSAMGAPGETVTLPVELDNQSPVQALSFGIGYDSDIVEITAIVPGQTLDDANSGVGPDFFHVIVDLEGEAGATVQCIVSTQAPFDDIAVGFDSEIALVDVKIGDDSEDGVTTDLALLDGLGAQPVPVILTVDGASRVPIFETGIVDVSGEPVSTDDPEFIRGDADGNGVYELFDIQSLMDWLFGTDTTGGPVDLTCDDVGDTNDDGANDLQDVLFLLDFIFNGGADLAEPFGECGTDETDDDLDCEDQC